jgi:hypothetical protein
MQTLRTDKYQKWLGITLSAYPGRLTAVKTRGCRWNSFKRVYKPRRTGRMHIPGLKITLLPDFRWSYVIGGIASQSVKGLCKKLVHSGITPV